MDEIDAALDFKNVSIVANYIKERTKNAQFVIISLRNYMFELANRLVGIYKTRDWCAVVSLQFSLSLSLSHTLLFIDSRRSSFSLSNHQHKVGDDRSGQVCAADGACAARRYDDRHGANSSNDDDADADDDDDDDDNESQR